MAHNPPRVWMTDEHIRNVRRSVARQEARWHSLDDLADKMLAKAAQGKRVVLSPGTAAVVARVLKGLTTRTD